VFFYHKGMFIQEDNHISCRDRSFLFGDGFFTTFKIDQGRVLFLDKHLQRLKQTAQKLSIPWRISLQELNVLLSELYRLNRDVAPTFRVRVMVSRGEGLWGEHGVLKPELFIFFSPWQATHVLKSLIISKNQIDDLGLLSCYKTTSRLSYVQALNEAHANGADDALIVNFNQELVCSSCANVWIVDEQDKLLTPKHGLQGITQMALLDCFSGKAFQQNITLAMLEKAKLIFLSNSMVTLQQAYLSNQPEVQNQALFEAIQKEFVSYQRDFETNLLD
jgi:branched-subunit amino acid aminotransferase/4-amino-4-deoxychorismate lyase